MLEKEFKTILAQINTVSIFVIDSSFSKLDYVPIDLSKTNADLKAVNVSSSVELGEYVNSEIEKQNGRVGVGGYLETRDIYARSAYFNKEKDANDERNIHLGVDLWIAAGTTVLAALNGVVHSFKNNLNHGDYGPTIILKHQISEVTFYTLYGHLSEASIANLKVGQVVKKGEVIGKLGDTNVNGDYPPHLHFQIIHNIQSHNGEYPGVASFNTLAFYKTNCPDPKLLLGL